MYRYYLSKLEGDGLSPVTGFKPALINAPGILHAEIVPEALDADKKYTKKRCVVKVSAVDWDAVPLKQDDILLATTEELKQAEDQERKTARETKLAKQSIVLELTGDKYEDVVMAAVDYILKPPVVVVKGGEDAVRK